MPGLARRCPGVILVSTILAVLAGSRMARAAECPSTPPGSLKERRALAKEWFTRAETEELGGEDKAAVKAYSCSFSMLPHPSTAYNLARAAERAGDLPVALAAHRDYLTLKPTASDRPEVEERIRVLEGKLLANPDPPAPEPAPAATPEPEPVATPAVIDLAPVPTSSPPRRLKSRRAPEPSPSHGGTAEWVIGGVGAAALVAGVVFNLGSRAAMSDCRELARGNNIAGARDACDKARPFAYASYGLFAAAGAAAIIDVTLLLSRHPTVERLGMVLVPGGATLSASGRF